MVSQKGEKNTSHDSDGLEDHNVSLEDKEEMNEERSDDAGSSKGNTTRRRGKGRRSDGGYFLKLKLLVSGKNYAINKQTKRTERNENHAWKVTKRNDKDEA